MPDAAKSAASASPSPGKGYPREARLLRRTEFDAVYREGRRRSGRHFTVFLRPNGLDRSRFGVSVKRQLGTAVVRNRIRRRIREIFRVHRQQAIPAGYDVVVHPRAAVATAEFAALEKELVQLILQVLRNT